MTRSRYKPVICITQYHYNETNAMLFSVNLLRINYLYMFRALLAHPQEALHKRHIVYCVHIFSVGCAMGAVKLQPCHSQLTLYARNIPKAVCVAPPENEQLMLETCSGHWFSIKWMKSASRWFHYTYTQNFNNNNRWKWVDTRWQWSFYILHMHGLWRLITLDLVGKGYMGSM
jgi:hypothetical protein